MARKASTAAAAASEEEMSKFTGEEHVEEEMESAAVDGEKTINVTLSQLTALINEAVEKKLSEAEALAVTAPAAARKSAQLPPEAAEADRRSKELVTIKFFYDGKRYKDPITFSVNGVSYTYERGKYIEVPRFIVEIYENMEKQDQNAAEVVRYFQDRLETMNNQT